MKNDFGINGYTEQAVFKTYNEEGKRNHTEYKCFSKDCIIYDNHFIGSAPCMPARRDIFTGRMQFLERGWGGS